MNKSQIDLKKRLLSVAIIVAVIGFPQAFAYIYRTVPSSGEFESKSEACNSAEQAGRNLCAVAGVRGMSFCSCDSYTAGYNKSDGQKLYRPTVWRCSVDVECNPMFP